MESQRLFCTFRVDGRLFGVDILDVKEVTAETTYTRVAHSPEEDVVAWAAGDVIPGGAAIDREADHTDG